MTQRIVIKTAVSKTAPTVETVSYQWHWRRIFAVSSVVLLSAAGVTYGLTKAVIADEIHTKIPATMHNERADIVPSVDEKQSPEQLTSAIDLNEASEQNKAAEQFKHSTGIVVAEVSPFVKEAVADVDKIQASEDELVVNNEDVNNAQAQATQQESPSSVTNTVFSESAQVANVALGAKIDTKVVSRAVLTTGIEAREPIDVLQDNLKRTQFLEKLYFFTEIKNLQGKVVHHLWFHQDQLMAEIPLEVGSIRYRTYSSKNIMPSQTGQWRVEVVTQQGQLLAQKSFRIIPDTQ
jgi:hypothetical protein